MSDITGAELKFADDVYLVTGVLGRGGSGATVYGVEVIDSGEKRAVKVFPHTPHEDFLNEAGRSYELSQLSPHILTTHAYGYATARKDGALLCGPLQAMVMDHARGTLADRLRRGPLGTRELVRDIGSLAAGLQTAHDKGTVHRDVKPSNIFYVNGVNGALIGDFGTARKALNTVDVPPGADVSGTPAYMAPEQYDGASCRSDQYSVGLVAFEAATGLRPFRPVERHDPPDFAQILTEVSRPLHGIERVIRRALEVSPERRFDDMLAFKLALEAALDEGWALQRAARTVIAVGAALLPTLPHVRDYAVDLMTRPG